MLKGSCLCGAVRFEVDAEALEPPDACHCTMCRKQSGHYWVGANVPRSTFTLHGADNVTWYRSSEKVRRGFCSTCGCALFWDPLDQEKHTFTGVALGAFDTPTNTKLALHIYVASKGDYYDITDGLPQKE